MASQYPNTDKYMNAYGKSVVAEMKTRLANAGKKATGALAKSVKYEIDPKTLTLSFEMNEYGKYVDKGVTGHGKLKGLKGLDKNGNKKKLNKGQFDPYDKKVHAFGSKMPPDNAELKKWMKVKGIPKELNFVIRRSIWMFGIAPTNFFSIPTTRRQKQFEQGLGDVMALDFDKQLQKELNGSNK